MMRETVGIRAETIEEIAECDKVDPGTYDWSLVDRNTWFACLNKSLGEAYWYTLSAKRFYKPDSFDFKLESIGVFKNIEIIHNAIEILIFKLDTINQLCNDEQIELDKTATAMLNSFDIKLVGEDYTIGKVIEYILHEEYYKKQKLLNYVGFIKKHPHDDYSIIRVAFKETDDLDVQTHENVYKILQFACEVGKKLFLNIKEYF